MMAKFSVQITGDQRKRLVLEAIRTQEKRQQRKERRRKLRDEREPNS
jgi:hypothetical protein